MFTRFAGNVRRWPRVFTVLVMLTMLELGIDFGLCRYIGRQSLGDSLFIISVVILAVGVVAGVTYRLLVPMHAFNIANILDRIEGRYLCAIASEPGTEDNLFEEEYDEYEEESNEDEDEDEETHS